MPEKKANNEKLGIILAKLESIKDLAFDINGGANGIEAKAYAIQVMAESIESDINGML